MLYKKMMGAILGTVMAGMFLTGCASLDKVQDSSGGKGEAGANGSVDLSQHVSLVLYLYGSPGVANDDILAEINKKLTADINTSIEVKYIDWGDVSTKYPLLWASGEAFDMAYASVSTAVPFYTLAKQGSLYNISDMLGKCAPALKEQVGEEGLNAVTSDGGIYGVPSMGGGFNVTGFVYNKANCKDWGIEEVTDLASMEAYCDASVAHGIYPINGNADVAMDFYRMLEGCTGNWIAAPGISSDEPYFVCRDYHDYQDVIHPAFTDEFEQFAKMLNQWAAKGYWPSDILSASTGDKEMYKNGQSSAYITHMGDWTGNYTAVHGKLPNQDIDAWYFEEAANKVIMNSPAQDITVINANSKYPERCLMAIEKFMTDESYYNLWQHGLEGRQYVMKDGYLEKPDSYDEAKDAGGFSAWAFSNRAFALPLKTEHPSRYVKLAEWEKSHIENPYNGFSFDSSEVSTELSAISNVNSTLGIQLMLGKAGDVEKAVKEYREQLVKAGIDKVLEELKKQLADFKPAGALQD